MLAQASTIRQIKLLRDTAEAVRKRAKSMTLGRALRNRAAEIKLLSERKAGAMLAGLRLQGGDRRSAGRPKRLGLREFGVSPNQSARWQRAALVPQAILERYLHHAAEQGREPTSWGLVQAARTWGVSCQADARSSEILDQAS
jgi:hypothetical protein